MLVSAPNGYAVGPSVGLSTNIPVLAPGPNTNTLVFTKGLLTAVQRPPPSLRLAIGYRLSVMPHAPPPPRR